jgi:hypothetical protein
LLARLARPAICASLTIAAVGAAAGAQATQIARNRFKADIAFQAEPVPDTGAKVGRFLLRGPSGYLVVPNTTVEVAPLASARNWTGHWVLRRLPDNYVHFLNEKTGSTLHFETGTAQVGAIQPGWWSAMWAMSAGSLFPSTATPVATRQVLVNRWKPQTTFEIEVIDLVRVRLRTTEGYLSAVNGRVGITPAIAPNTASSSSEWVVYPLPPATRDCARPDCFFRVMSTVMSGMLNNESGPLAVTSTRDDWYSAMWSRAPGTVTPTTPVPLISAGTSPVARQVMINRANAAVAFEVEPSVQGRIRMRTTAGYLSLVNGRVGITTSPVSSTSASSDWVLTPVPPAAPDCIGITCFFRLTSPIATGSLNNYSGPLAVTAVALDWNAAMWIRAMGIETPTTPIPAIASGETPVASARQTVTNRWKPEFSFEIEPTATTRVRLRTGAVYVSVTNGRVSFTPSIVVNSATATSEWNLVPVPPATQDCARPDCFFRLTSPVAAGALNTESGPIAISAFRDDWYSAMWIRGPTSGSPATGVAVTPAPDPTPLPTSPTAPKSIMNRFRAQITMQPVRPNSLADTAYVHLRMPNGTFVVVNNRQLQYVTAGYGLYLGMWRLEPIPNESYSRIVNRATGDYLHTESGVLGIGTVAAGTMNMAWWSGMWIVVR